MPFSIHFFILEVMMSILQSLFGNTRTKSLRDDVQKRLYSLGKQLFSGPSHLSLLYRLYNTLSPLLKTRSNSLILLHSARRILS